MNVLIIGSGAREHALGWKIKQSPRLRQLYFAPGNPGTAELGINLPVDISNFESLREEVIRHQIGLMVVGPEVPLVAGIHDFFASGNKGEVKIIGPKKSGAKLEGSKDFAKGFLTRHRIPTAAYSSFTKHEMNDAFQYLERLTPPYVLKADGLAAGKGVIIAETTGEAKKCLREMLGGQFGKASETVIIEEFLSGVEVSVFILTDGKDYVLLPEAKDYKRIGENDTGLNTGGMGAVSPVPFADQIFMRKVRDRIIEPTLRGIQAENIEYCGFIFFGLINCMGDPYVIEYNVRLGDPETEAILPRIHSDFLELLEAAANKELKNKTIETEELSSAVVMLVSGGYPEEYEKGKEITGIGQGIESLVFHAGTKMESGLLKTAGGRVLALNSKGTDMKEALAKCYRSARLIGFDGKYYRSDIGFDLKK